ncbi:hypothetical protein [Lewinella sp. JB7]|uniref:hypothetical protein n=1 Tax=Lewinella sp. JB7 TaxID=2962887 RepID=UPI0020C97CDA|nr:hypothetical protein [Lewinella sp. JB7]MCP9236255.1 hypothetical protein [Lewinella sp. JB7]
MRAISKRSGQGGDIEGAYIENDNYQAMLDYAESKLGESNPGPNYDQGRESYDLFSNNCATFGCDVLNADPEVNDASPFTINIAPNAVKNRYQDYFDRVTYDSETGPTSYHVRKSEIQKFLDLFRDKDDGDEQ